jgi:hypothetical protein
MAGKDAGEKQMFRLTPLLRFLPYYLISNSVPFLITHQVLPRNYGYVIRHKVKNWSSSLMLLIYLYQTSYISVKKILKNNLSIQKYVITAYQKTALKGILTD